MNSVQLSKTIETKRMQLKGRDLFWHYSPCLFLSIPSSFLIFLYTKSVLDSNILVSKKLLNDQSFFWLFTIIAVIYFVIKYTELNFKIIPSSQNHKHYKTAINNTAKAKHWTTVAEKNNYYKAISKKRIFTWGEEITIIKTKEHILFNSMNSLIFRPSIFSFIENKTNLKAFKKNLASS
jgi:hypothetical protein